MPDIQSTPGTQQIQIFFGGSMDAITMGAPVYFWIMFFLGIGLFCLGMLVVYYRYWILNNIWAFVECYRKRKPLALVRNRNRQAYLKPLKYIAQVFEDEAGVDKWFASALESAQSISGIPLVDACDYYDWLQDPILNQAISEIVNSWNNGIYDAEGNQLKAPHADEDKIYDPLQFQQLLGSGVLKDYFDGTEIVTYKKGSVRIPAFFIVDVSKVEQYLPRTRSSSMFGGYTTWLSDVVGNKEKENGMTFLKYVAVGCTALIICGILAGLMASGKL
jgi:hypothetical protein